MYKRQVGGGFKTGGNIFRPLSIGNHNAGNKGACDVGHAEPYFRQIREKQAEDKSDDYKAAKILIIIFLELSENQIEDDAENNGEHKESHDFRCV